MEPGVTSVAGTSIAVSACCASWARQRGSGGCPSAPARNRPPRRRPGGDGLLTAHRVRGDERPFQVQHRQHVRHRGDFVRLVRHRLLRQHQPRLGGVGADQMDGLVALAAAAQGLAVHADLLPRQARQGHADPAHEGIGKGLALDPAHHFADRVVRRDAVPQLKKLAEPAILLQGKLLHPYPVLDAAQHGAQHNHQNVAQACAACSWFHGEGRPVRQNRVVGRAASSRCREKTDTLTYHIVKG